MNKEELKQYLKNMQLEEGLETMLFDLIEKAPQVDQVLLNTVADILDLQADFYEQNAEMLEEEAEEYETLAAELNTLDEEENTARVEALLEHQKTLLSDINQKMDETKNQQSAQQLSDLRQDLHQIAQPVQSNPTNSTPVALPDQPQSQPTV
jgi:hypothetical protein